MADVEITHPKHAGFALFPGLAQLAQVALQRQGGMRPVNEQQVYIIGLQLAQAFFHGGQEALPVQVGRPYLGHQENLLPADARLPDALPDGFFIGVKLGGVDMAVALLQGQPDDVGGGIAFNQVGAQAEGGNGGVLDGEVLHGVGLLERNCFDEFGKKQYSFGIFILEEERLYVNCQLLEIEFFAYFKKMLFQFSRVG